ncbi:hypothetical protein EDB89DRAFT_1906459 [Lactarius sanguifluus]|nr:hypothetical protein EDB89DRAFT_1915939 [Lactarius sanguifluus]KAH9172190.1 hypothetical protein EDB89DRAFT_1906459 [Lactarius sanguifluus]
MAPWHDVSVTACGIGVVVPWHIAGPVACGVVSLSHGATLVPSVRCRVIVLRRDIGVAGPACGVVSLSRGVTLVLWRVVPSLRCCNVGVAGPAPSVSIVALQHNASVAGPAHGVGVVGPGHGVSVVGPGRGISITARCKRHGSVSSL